MANDHDPNAPRAARTDPRDDGTSPRRAWQTVATPARLTGAAAAGAPVALIALAALPRHRPAGLTPLLIGITVAAVLAVPAALARSGVESRPRGAAAVLGAASWWVARVGAAGLLSAVGVAAIGPSLSPWIGAGLAFALVFICAGGPAVRHLVPAALGLVAGAGLVVSTSGVIALWQGRLNGPLLPSGPIWAGNIATGTFLAQCAATVLTLCLAAVCAPPLRARGSPLPSGPAPRRRRHRHARRVASLTALASWGLVVPVLGRLSGLSLASVAARGGAGALRSALGTALSPLAGSDAGTLARLLLAGTCLAAAVGLAAGGAAAAGAAGVHLGRLRSAGGAGRRRRTTLSLSAFAAGAGPPGAAFPRDLPLLAGAGGGIIAAGCAVAGSRPPVVMALGGLAALALGLSLSAALPRPARRRVERLNLSASVLAERVLPALAQAVESMAGSRSYHAPSLEVSELRAALRRLEGASGSHQTAETAELTRAVVEACRQAFRLASGIQALSVLDDRRLQGLVEERTAVLSQANRHLVHSQWGRRQLLDRTVRVAENERARIAANLHDGPIQRLAALGLVLDRCHLRLEREDTAGGMELVERARAELSDEIQSLRQMMSELRPPILDEGGLEAAVRDQLSNWSTATGTESRLEASAFAPLDDNSETVVYRVVQEALANVAKHAKATHVVVSLAQQGNGLQAVVRDNGTGFKLSAQPDLLRGGHFGIVGMRERVELAGGRFEVTSAPLAGTQVSLWLPAPPVSGDAAEEPARLETAAPVL